MEVALLLVLGLSTRRLSAVRWGVGREIVTAWVLTFPVCGALAWLAAKAFSLLF